MESPFDQIGVRLPRETLENWCIIANKKFLPPNFKPFNEELLKHEIVYVDETACQILQKEGALCYASLTERVHKIQ